MTTRECHTQTSKTILQLALTDLNQLNEYASKINDNARSEPSDVHCSRRNVSYYQRDVSNNMLEERKIPEGDSMNASQSLVAVFLKKQAQMKSKIEVSSPEDVFNDDEFGNADDLNIESNLSEAVSPFSRFTIKKIQVKAFADNKSDATRDIDYSIASTSTLTNTDVSSRADTDRTEKLKLYNFEKMNSISIATYGTELHGAKDVFHSILVRIKNENWDTSLNALIEMAELSNILDHEKLYVHMPEINQRLITFLRSPRSHVCRMSCQIAGRFFETVKDTRRPEYDEIVDVLLSRTADYNRFIRKEANVALDSMILHISPFYTVRAISQKGPGHKNDLVRITAARLFVCIVGISGANLFLNSSSNEHTRKRIITHMINFMKDKHAKAREYGERIYEVFKHHPNFEVYLTKVVGKNSVAGLLDFFKSRSR